MVTRISPMELTCSLAELCMPCSTPRFAPYSPWSWAGDFIPHSSALRGCMHFSAAQDRHQPGFMEQAYGSAALCAPFSTHRQAPHSPQSCITLFQKRAPLIEKMLIMTDHKEQKSCLWAVNNSKSFAASHYVRNKLLSMRKRRFWHMRSQ